MSCIISGLIKTAIKSVKFNINICDNLILTFINLIVENQGIFEKFRYKMWLSFENFNLHDKILKLCSIYVLKLIIGCLICIFIWKYFRIELIKNVKTIIINIKRIRRLFENLR